MLKLGLLLLALFVFFPLFAVAFSRAVELFKLDVHDRRIDHRRGRIPPQLLREIADLFAHTPAHGTIRAVVRDGRPYVIVKGAFSAEETQRIRNVVGLYPLARIRAGKKPR